MASLKIKSKLTLLMAGLVALASSNTAYADAGWEWTTTGNNSTDGVWDFATAFTVNTNITLTGLGYYADPVTGNVDGNAVAFYQCADASCLTTGTLLTSTNVTNTYAVSGHFRYVTVAPIDLIAGQSYEVAGVSNADDYAYIDSGFAANPDITLLNGSTGQVSRWQSLSTPDFLTGSPFQDLGASDGYWGPNVFFGTATFTGSVPEPATWAMMLIGFGMVGIAMRKRSNVTTKVTYA